MALQTVEYPQPLFLHKNDPDIDLYTIIDDWSWDFNFPKSPDGCFTQELGPQLGNDQTPWELNIDELSPMVPSLSNENNSPASSTATRPKRRRNARKSKNKEEIETQRMTHIAVERNRRKQMNDYLSTLKSMLPHSYVQRSDQASIVGAAINFVKQLEQNLHTMSTEKALPFSEFFSFPQYSTMADSSLSGEAKRSGIADVEVFIVEGHANLKIRTRKHPKQLLKLVIGLHNLRLTVLHLNVNTLDQFCLYSFNLKVEEDSKLNSKEEIATEVHQLLFRIKEEV